MSKNITIQEGGLAKQITVDKLKTNLGGSGTCLWVPEDEVQLGTKTITENGTYKASDEGLYGYSEVMVSGIGTVTGKDPDGSGDDAKATVDPETGEITVTKIPSSIRVIEPPTNPYGIYRDGQAISKDGMVVKAYLESGGEYGMVPNDEIALNPTVAIYDASRDEPAGGTSTLGGESIDYIASSVYSAGKLPESSLLGTKYIIDGGSDLRCYRIPANSVHTIVISKTQFTITRELINGDGSITRTETGSTSGVTSESGTTFYTASWNPTRIDDYPYFSPSAPMADKNYRNEEAATIFYDGDTTSQPAGSPQTITVSWPRPGDDKVLETTFEILVAPGYTPGGEE